MDKVGLHIMCMMIISDRNHLETGSEQCFQGEEWQAEGSSAYEVELMIVAEKRSR